MKKTGIIFILFTANNVLCSFTTLEGSVVAWTSAGTQKSKGLKKTVPFIISSCVTKLVSCAIQKGFSNAHLKLKGFNKNKKFVIKVLHQVKISLLSYQDLTTVPHNGCRKRKKKRL